MPGEANGTRVIALVGPAGAGKTSLAEAILFASGATDRQGSVDAGSSIGDSSVEARTRGGSTELNAMHFDYLGDHYALIDCPGSIGFAADGAYGVAASDLAIVVVDPDPARDELGVPHMIFVNRIDQAHSPIRELIAALQPMSITPLIARQVPLRQGDKITGFIDVALERAFQYRPGKPSEVIAIPDQVLEREHEARAQLLERLADHDDVLLEQILLDQTPEPDTIFADLAKETADNLGVSILFGSANSGAGVRRLLKAIRHETPAPRVTAQRLDAGSPSVLALKVSHAGTLGRAVICRVFGGAIEEGAELHDSDRQTMRIGAIFAVQGERMQKVGRAAEGDLVALGKVDRLRAGQWLSAGTAPPAPSVTLPARNCTLAIEPADRKDDVKLSGALAKLIEEDVSLRLEQDDASHEMRLQGVNSEQLATVLARLKRRYGVEATSRPPAVGYRESIRRSVTQRGRHKKQSGGHGQYGDVIIEVSPLPRGEGYRFEDRITGGAIPRQWIPAVEQGIKDAMARGPLGFPVVDVAVTLTDGSYHSVDSSELAFRLAGRLAMSEALAAASPHLLEPMQRVVIHTPNHATSRASGAISSRRGQVLGIAPRDDWTGWDRIDAMLPDSELPSLDAELRSVSQGLATYEAQFDHLAEVNGKLADGVVQQRQTELA